jgi:hypothetical protein
VLYPVVEFEKGISVHEWGGQASSQGREHLGQYICFLAIWCVLHCILTRYLQHMIVCNGGSLCTLSHASSRKRKNNLENTSDECSATRKLWDIHCTKRWVDLDGWICLSGKSPGQSAGHVYSCFLAKSCARCTVY